MKISYENFLNKPIDKSKITSVWSSINDNQDGSWDHVIHNNHKYICFLLSETSEYFNLNEIDYIFDLGSLNGIESVYFSQLLPNCKVYSFEANPNSALLVRENQKHYPNTYCVNKAVSSYNGKSQFYLTQENIGASSLLKPLGGYAGNQYSTIDVDVTTVENFCKENNIPKIDILWMDLQGNELNALKGMGDLLYTTKMICSEVGLKPYYENHTLYDEIYNYLKIFGFEVSNKEYPFPYPRNLNNLECDFIFINKRLCGKKET
jgi:FkbM family methyltransferase